MILIAVLFFGCGENSTGPKIKSGESLYPDGSLQESYSYYVDKQTKQEVRDGESISYYRNGNVKSQGFYEAGLKVGAWVEYHENGIKRSEEYYKVGLADSTWAIYNEAGLCEYFQTYENGFLIGFEGQQADDQSINFSGQYTKVRLYFDEFETEEDYDYLRLFQGGSRILSLSGNIDSGWSEWYALAGGTDDIEIVFYSDEGVGDRGFSISRLAFQGESGDFEAEVYVDITDGPGDYLPDQEMNWSVSVPDPVRSVDFQIVRDPSTNAPTKHGPYKASYADGAFFEVGNYTNGQKDGEWKGYYPNGTLRYVECWHLQSDGRSVLDGVSVHYYPDGVKEREYNYADGRLHGAYMGYYSDGTFRYKGAYANGKRTGAFERFYADGRLQDVTTYSGNGFESRLVYQYDDKKTKRRAFTYTEENILDGLAQYYDSLSGARVVAEGNFKDGLPWDGTFENYMQGWVSTQEYRAGERWSGRWRTDTMSSLVQYSDDEVVNTDFLAFPCGEDCGFDWFYDGLFSLVTGTGGIDGDGSYPYANTISIQPNDWWSYYLEQTLARRVRYADLYYEDGKLTRAVFHSPRDGWSAEAHYADGVLDGEWKVWWPSGRDFDELESVPVMETGMFEAGRPVGSWSGQYEDGQPAFAAEFDDSGQLSTMEVYYRSGNVLVRRSFESDTVALYEDSAGEQLIVSGGISDDDQQRLGTWTYYGEDGSAAFQETYDASGARLTTELEGTWSSEGLSFELDATSALVQSAALGARWTQVRLYFSEICTESSYDYVRLYDENGSRIWGGSGCADADFIMDWRDLEGAQTLQIGIDSDGSVNYSGFVLEAIQFQNSSERSEWLAWYVTDGAGNYSNNLNNRTYGSFEVPQPLVDIAGSPVSWTVEILPISYDNPSYRRFRLRLGDSDIFYVVSINGDTIQLENDITLIRSSAAGKMADSIQPAPYRRQNIEFISGNTLQVNSSKVKRSAIND